MIFLISIDSLKSIVIVKHEFISFHQDDDIVHLRSSARTTHASYGNDFLSLNFDHRKTYGYR